MVFPNELGKIKETAGSIYIARNLFDAFSSISTPSLNNLMVGRFGPAGLVLRPHQNYQHHSALHHNTHYERTPHHCIEYTRKAYQKVTAMLARCMNQIAQQNILQSLARDFRWPTWSCNDCPICFRKN
jgi:hypothetical protein